MTGLVGITTKAGLAGAPLVEFSDVRSLQIRDQLSQAGQLPESTLEVSTLGQDGSAHPALAYLTRGNVIHTRDATGTSDIFEWVIEKRARDLLDAVDPSNVQWKITGRPKPIVLADARWAPARGAGARPWGPTRVFGFASPEYDPAVDGRWSTATAYEQQRNATTLWTGQPDGMVCRSAYYIGPSTGNQVGAPIGYWYTRFEFTLADDSLLYLPFAADNRMQGFFDGFPLGNIDAFNDTTAGFKTTHAFTVFATAGTHVFAAKITNLPFDGSEPSFGSGANLAGNPTMLVGGCYRVGSNGQLVERLWVTDDTWDILEYPDYPPGMTIGQIYGIGLDEAHARGVLTYVGKTFDDVNDSNGNPWPIAAESVSVTTMQSMFDTLEQHSLSYCDYGMQTGSWDLDLYRIGERGQTLDGGGSPARPLVVYSQANKNLVHLSVDGIDDDTDAVWGTWKGGQIRYPATGGEREGFIQTDAETAEEAEFVFAAWLALRGGEVAQITPAIRPRNDAEAPGTGYWLGDAPGVNDGTGTVYDRLMAVVGTWTLNAGWDWAVALRNKHLDDRGAISLWLHRMAPGAAGGAGPGSPVGAPPSFSSKQDTNEVTWTFDNPLTVRAGPEKRPRASQNVFEVWATVTTALATDTTFEFIVDGVDILNGAGLLPASVKHVKIPVGPDDIYWIGGGESVCYPNVTAAGDLVNLTDKTNLLIELRSL